MSDSVRTHGADTDDSPLSRAPADQGAGNKGGEQGKDLPTGSPIHPPSSTSTRDPAPMDGWLDEIAWTAYEASRALGSQPFTPPEAFVSYARVLATAVPELIRFARGAAAVEALIDHARKVSPSPSMTVYVGDLEHALGIRRDGVRGIVGERS